MIFFPEELEVMCDMCSVSRYFSTTEYCGGILGSIGIDEQDLGDWEFINGMILCPECNEKEKENE